MTNNQLHKKIKWFSAIETILAIVLIVREVIQYFTLRSIYEPDNGLIIEFEKYKENVYSPLLMWLIVLFAGIKLMQFKKVGWILNESLLTMIYLSSTFILFYLLFPIDIVRVIVIVIYTAIYILAMKVLNNKQLLKSLNIEKSDKIVGIIIGVGLSFIYWIIKVYLENFQF